MGLETSGGPSVDIPELGSKYFCSLCGFSECLGFSGGSDSKKNLPAIQETWVRSLGWEDPLKKGTLLQYSCLENSMDREAWWAMVRRVTKSQTELSN